MAKQNEAELSRLERAKFVHEIQHYLKGAAATLHSQGVDISQMQWDGRQLLIGIDSNHPPDQAMEIHQNTVRAILHTRYPKLTIGFNPVAMNPAPLK